MSIKVNATSKLAKALRLHPDVLDYIVSLNPHDFKRLYNPLMRRMMPPRITLARVAKMTNIPIMQMLVRIHEIAESPLTETERKELLSGVNEVESDNLPANPENAPQWIKHNVAVIVNLLENDARLDADPLPPIMKSLKKLAADELMMVKHKWEPQPLYDIWSKQGVEYYAEQKSPDEWWIYLRWKE